jgi:hypothetical protein
MNWTGIGYSKKFGFYREYFYEEVTDALLFITIFDGTIDRKKKTVRI